MLLKDVMKTKFKYGNYEIDVDFESIKYTLDRYKERFNLNMNPEFQRGYVWTKEQQISYVEFILKGGKSANIIYFNQEGWNTTYEGEMVLMDGQQRLGAILAFVNNELPVFGGYYLNDFEDKEVILRRNSIRFNVNNLNEKEVLQWYIDNNTGGTMHTNEEIDKVKEMLKNLQ